MKPSERKETKFKTTSVLPDGKLKMLLQFPRFLGQRKEVLVNPNLILAPPTQADWVDARKFVSMNITYILLFVGFPKAVFLFFNIKTLAAAKYMAGIEWTLPLFLVLSSRLLVA